MLRPSIVRLWIALLVPVVVAQRVMLDAASPHRLSVLRDLDDERQHAVCRLSSPPADVEGRECAGAGHDL